MRRREESCQHRPLSNLGPQISTKLVCYWITSCCIYLHGKKLKLQKQREIGRNGRTQKPIVLLEGSASILRPVLADSPQTLCPLLCSPNTVDLLSHTLQFSLLLHSLQILARFSEKNPSLRLMKPPPEKSALSFSWELKILATCLLPSSHLLVPDDPYLGNRKGFCSRAVEY